MQIDATEPFEEQHNTDLSTYLLIDCSIQTYLQFKRRFSATNTILPKIEQFLHKFLLNTLLIQTTKQEFDNIKSYLVQKGFQSILDSNSELNDLSKAHHQFVEIIDNKEFNELKIRNLLSLIHRSFETSSEIDNSLLVDLLSLCKQEDVKKRQNICELVLNDSIIRENSFKSKNLIEFLINLADLNDEFQSKSLFDDYLNKFLRLLDDMQTNNDDEKLDLGLKMVSKLKNLNKTFLFSLNHYKNISSKEYYAVILLKNRDVIVNNENIRLFERCFKNLLKFLTKFWEEKAELSLKMISLEDLDKFLCDCYNFKPNLCSYLARKVVKKAKKFDGFMLYLDSYLKNFVGLIRLQNGDTTTQMEVDENKIGVVAGDFNSDYSFTLSRKDQDLVKNQFKITNNLNFLKYTHNFTEEDEIKKQTHLNIEVKLNDFINEKLNSEIMEKSILNFQVSRKISDVLLIEEDVSKIDNADVYDPVYLLANFYSLLHYGKS
jgi:hypothetical protein